MQAQIEIHVVEDHPLFRAAVVRALDGAPDMRVGVVAGSVEQFAAFRAAPGAIVTLDLSLPRMSGAQAVAEITGMGFHVLVLSASGGQSEVLSAMAAGARGYLTKECDVDELCRAARHIAAGNRYVSPTLAAFLLDPVRLRPPDASATLSQRERQVLALLAAGQRDRDIADRLSISVRTVRSHLDHIREKTGRRRRPDLTRLAIEKGILLKEQRT